MKIKYFLLLHVSSRTISLCRLILQIACVLQKFATFLVMDEFHQTGKTFQFKHAIISQMNRINIYLHVSQICMTIFQILSICMFKSLNQSEMDATMSPHGFDLHYISFCLFQDVLYSELVYLALVALTTYPPYIFLPISKLLTCVLFWFKIFAKNTLHLKCFKNFETF